MIYQLPEEKKDLIIPLFKKTQPNRSALGCYLNGTLSGKTFVDDLSAPTKAICHLDLSWVYISDDADFPWIEETLREIIKTAWIQVVWAPERKGKYPLPELGKVIPRHEYIERKEPLQKPSDAQIIPFSSEWFDKLPDPDFQEFHIHPYGSKEKFLEQSIGFYAIENGEICSDFTATFISNGYTELDIYTFDPHRKKGYAYAACVRGLEELDKKGLKGIWACDVENTESMQLAAKLGFVNPVEYDFIFFSQKND